MTKGLWLIVLLGSIFFLTGCQADSAPEQTSVTRPEGRPWKLICLGDGLTAGAGLKPDELAYPAHLAALLSTATHPAKVVNAGLKGESLRAAAGRLPWMFQQRLDALLLAMGQAELDQNQDLASWTRDWDFLLTKVREIDPEVDLFVTVLASHSPPVEYVEAVQELAIRHAAHYLKLPLADWTAQPDRWIEQGEEVYCSAAGQVWLAETLAEYFNELRE